MSDMKGMEAFGFTLTYVSLNYSPSASSIEKNVCKKCTKYTSPIPPMTGYSIVYGTRVLYD